MPVSIDTELVRLSQAEFAEVAYGIMAEIFTLHRELGRLFDEKIYGNALAARLDNVQREVPINISFRDFQKQYFMDAVASSGAVFELKAVDALHTRHRGQLLNYLMLADLRHGKLVNVRSEQIEHEFVNNVQSHAERTKFGIDDANWQATAGCGIAEKTLVEEMVRDWGTGLERSLYEEAIIHLSGGAEHVLNDVVVFLDGTPLAKQTIALYAPRIAFRLTTFENNTHAYRKDLATLLNRTELEAIQWINISRKKLTFETLKQKS